MNPKMIKIAAIMLVLAGSLSSCNEKMNGNTDDLFLEVSPESKSQIIEKEINGITFKFCLLNEQEQPATVFNEGENFSFYFSSKNTGKRDLYFNAAEVSYNKDFFRVYNSSGTDLGKSYDPFLQTDIGIVAYSFNIGDEYVIKVPWLHEKDPIRHPGNLPYDSIFQKPLAKGNYYTSFRNSFYYVVQQGGDWVRTDSINFNINFQIK